MPRKTARGYVDKDFKCPADLYAAWNTNEKPHALSANFKWTKGDEQPKGGEKPFVPRDSADACTSAFYLTSRSFRMLSGDALAVRVPGASSPWPLLLLKSVSNNRCCYYAVLADASRAVRARRMRRSRSSWSRCCRRTPC